MKPALKIYRDAKREWRWQFGDVKISIKTVKSPVRMIIRISKASNVPQKQKVT